ncbi:pentatricopeptide repeat-containing protein at3g51320 [Phtheirospermum japonicum]|uniref:Pentatricopeptide repeat-containing protein at3g51320 n=1 Tax=Phtheirospermum japonicum TaxID=374723 RepID=A0A830CNT7_9LAMI|nr:pentatricopeptide repeat-containing protein at3g51320 [Phtheirospermum japonicum]
MCHGHASKYGVDCVLPVQNSLVHFYACCGLMDVACIVFDEMPTRDLVTWNTIIDGFAKVGEMGLAHKMFDKMPVRNVVSWNVMITGYLDFQNPGNALKLFREMMARRFVSSDTTVVNVIVACGRSNQLKEGKPVHEHLFKTFLGSSLIIDTTMVDIFAKVGEMGLSHKMFDKMPVRNVVSWNVMITRYLDFRNPGNALKLFREMMARRFVSSNTNVVNVIVASGRSNRLKEGKSVHGHLFKMFLGSSLIIDTTMVYM